MAESNLPTVSIVTPAYNQAEFLRATIESVLSQDYPKIEYVVLDDGSTDETPQILSEYGDRFVWESQPNMGQTATINKGWAMTSGEIITWLNSDDTFYDPTSVRQAVDYLLENPQTGIVFGDSVFIDASGKHLERSKPQPPFSYDRFLIECNNTIAQPSTFIRRAVVEDVGYLDPNYYYTMDWDFWLRAGLQFQIDHTPALWSTYRLHAESKTVAHQMRAAPELEYMYTKFFGRDDLPGHVRRHHKEAMMNMAFRSAGFYLSGGDRDGAGKMARKAFRYNPGGFLSYSNVYKFLACTIRRSSRK